MGYRQVLAHLAGEFDEAELRERARAATRQLARRQLTWLRRWPGLERVEVTPGGAPPPAFTAALVERLRERLAAAVSADAGVAPP